MFPVIQRQRWYKTAAHDACPKNTHQITSKAALLEDLRVSLGQVDYCKLYLRFIASLHDLSAYFCFLRLQVILSYRCARLSVASKRRALEKSSTLYFSCFSCNNKYQIDQMDIQYAYVSLLDREPQYVGT